mgnify:CR=1 FL=1
MARPGIRSGRPAGLAQWCLATLCPLLLPGQHRTVRSVQRDARSQALAMRCRGRGEGAVRCRGRQCPLHPFSSSLASEALAAAAADGGSGGVLEQARVPPDLLPGALLAWWCSVRSSCLDSALRCSSVPRQACSNNPQRGLWKGRQRGAAVCSGFRLPAQVMMGSTAGNLASSRGSLCGTLPGCADQLFLLLRWRAARC